MNREARLKNRYAGQYHCLRPGVWRPAAGVADQVFACCLDHPGPRRPVRPGRLLMDDHFEFRGGTSREEARLTRVGEW